MEFQRYYLSDTDLNEDLKKSKSDITLMHRALIRLTMMLKKVKSWSMIFKNLKSFEQQYINS